MRFNILRSRNAPIRRNFRDAAIDTRRQFGTLQKVNTLIDPLRCSDA
jgi:hypothetical protein